MIAEAWGGPMDGETLYCEPAPNELGVWVDVRTRRLEIRGVATEPEPESDYWFLGVYRWTDPRRLTWVPK